MTVVKQFPALQVPARHIPVPRSISGEAQAVLGRAAEAAFVWPPYPDIADHEGWLRYVDAANANMRLMIEALPEPGDDRPFESIPLDGFSCFRIDGRADRTGSEERILFELHGGALVAGGGDLCRVMAARAAVRMDAIVYAPDYRMPPLHPFPTPLEDCLTAYRHVLERHRSASVVVHGGSAGGNLAAALMLRLKAEGLPLPGALVLESPELDLTESGDSFSTNEVIDVVLQRGLLPVNRLYAGGCALEDPLLSPLFGECSGGWPPTLLTAGTRDMFLSNAVRMLHRLRGVGARVELLVYEAMPHGGFFGTPEDRGLREDILQFAQRCWSGPGVSSLTRDP